MKAKEANLHEILRECGSVCIGYSGGVDSVYLATVARAVLGPERMLAVIGVSPSLPALQREVALRCARDFNFPVYELPTDEMDDANYVANPSNRCYFCKSELWSKLTAFADTRGYAVVADGTNADDITDHRPGMSAAAEHVIRSPLLEAGLTKAEIRELSRTAGLPTWDMPSAPCLSSRLAYGVAVTRERLQQVETAEERIRALGFREFRVRHHGSDARLEFGTAEIAKAAEVAETLYDALADLGFERILFDVEGYRRGAMNEAVPLVTIGRHHYSDIATVPGTPADLAYARSLVPQMKAQGYKFITIDLEVERS
jgi:uncharacterized protein